MKNAKGIASINNAPLVMAKYIVVRINKGEMWYYGSWNDLVMAQDVAEMIGGTYVERTEEDDLK